MNWFGEKKASKNETNISYKQGVIITIRLGESDEPEEKEFSAIQNLEEQIESVIPTNSGVDGDDFGDGECTIYVYGPSADKIWEVIESTLRESVFPSMEIMLQYGEPGAQDTKTRSFTL